MTQHKPQTLPLKRRIEGLIVSSTNQTPTERRQTLNRIFQLQEKIRKLEVNY